MLVRLEPSELPVGFEEDLATLGLTMVAVKHPLPARQRLHVVRPLVVLVGARVRGRDFEDLRREAWSVGAFVRELSPRAPRDELFTWLVDVVFDAGERPLRAS